MERVEFIRVSWERPSPVLAFIFFNEPYDPMSKAGFSVLFFWLVFFTWFLSKLFLDFVKEDCFSEIVLDLFPIDFETTFGTEFDFLITDFLELFELVGLLASFGADFDAGFA